MDEQEARPDAAAAEPTELERFLAQMLNASAEVADDYAAQVSAGLRRGDPADEGPREREMTPEEAQLAVERAAVEAVWDDVRGCSAEGHLVTPERWEENGVVPAHMTPDEFAVLVFDTLEACAEGRPFEGSGLPVVQEPAEDADGEGDSREPGIADEADGADQTEVTAEESAGSELGGEPEEAPDEQPDEALAEPHALEAARAPLACEDIAVLEGRKSTYLYARGIMSENFAHWAFLAAEDDDLATLADNVRQESRLYPRPMLAAAFRNPPYLWTKGRTEAAFEAVRACGAYPDIAQVTATNGDVYYYSTDYLSAAQARALAQWYSVEKPLNV